MKFELTNVFVNSSSQMCSLKITQKTKKKNYSKSKPHWLHDGRTVAKSIWTRRLSFPAVAHFLPKGEATTKGKRITLFVRSKHYFEIDFPLKKNLIDIFHDISNFPLVDMHFTPLILDLLLKIHYNCGRCCTSRPSSRSFSCCATARNGQRGRRSRRTSGCTPGRGSGGRMSCSPSPTGLINF